MIEINFKKSWKTIKNLIETASEFIFDTEYPMGIAFLIRLGLGIIILLIVVGLLLLFAAFPAIPVILLLLLIAFILGYICLMVYDDFIR